jgi:hypothetical protein
MSSSVAIRKLSLSSTFAIRIGDMMIDLYCSESLVQSNPFALQPCRKRESVPYEGEFRRHQTWEAMLSMVLIKSSTA